MGGASQTKTFGLFVGKQSFSYHWHVTPSAGQITKDFVFQTFFTQLDRHPSIIHVVNHRLNEFISFTPVTGRICHLFSFLFFLKNVLLFFLIKNKNKKLFQFAKFPHLSTLQSVGNHPVTADHDEEEEDAEKKHEI
jgi:hypothetical protein